MEQKTDRLYLSAPLDNIDLEQGLERKRNDVNSFIKKWFNTSETKITNQKKHIKVIKH